MHVDVIRTTASVGSSIDESGTESTRTSRLPCQVIAFIDTSYPAWTRLPGLRTGTRPTEANVEAREGSDGTGRSDRIDNDEAAGGRIGNHETSRGRLRRSAERAGPSVAHARRRKGAGSRRGRPRRRARRGGRTHEAAPEAAGAVASVASKAVAAAKGPVHLLRGTGEQEKLLKNAKTEYSDEAEEIATYTAIETLADAVGDRETAKVARGIRRDEERMQRFLERLIPQLTRAVARDEIPASERDGGPGRRGRR